MPQIDGSNGSWDYTVSRTNFSPPEDKIVLKFTPKSGVNCKTIRIVQTCKATAFDADNKEVPGPPEDWYRNRADADALYGPTRPDRVKDSEGRACYVDHNGCDKEPYQAEDDPKKPGGSTQMTDFPSVTFDKIIIDRVKKIVKSFMTAAICAETGEILGCISWTSTSSPGELGKISVDPPDKEVPVDETFKKALERFTKHHTLKKEGKTYWWCPDKVEDLAPGDRYGGEVPDGFRGKWLTIAAKDLKFSGDVQVGAAAQFESPGQALAACRESPHRAAIKFTWSGEHIKPIASVLLAPEWVTARDIAPHVRPERRFSGDFFSIRLFPVSTAWMLHVLAEAEAILRPTAISEGAATLTLISGIGTGQSASYVRSVSREEATAFAVRAGQVDGQDDLTLKALNFIALNMGSGGKSRS